MLRCPHMGPLPPILPFNPPNRGRGHEAQGSPEPPVADPGRARLCRASEHGPRRGQGRRGRRGRAGGLSTRLAALNFQRLLMGSRARSARPRSRCLGQAACTSLARPGPAAAQLPDLCPPRPRGGPVPAQPRTSRWSLRRPAFPKPSSPDFPSSRLTRSEQRRLSLINSRRADSLIPADRTRPSPEPRGGSPPPVPVPRRARSPVCDADLRRPQLRRRTPQTHAALPRSPRPGILARLLLTQPLRSLEFSPLGPALTACPRGDWLRRLAAPACGRSLQAWDSQRVTRLGLNLPQGR